jgi:hypothetical protein
LVLSLVYSDDDVSEADPRDGLPGLPVSASRDKRSFSYKDHDERRGHETPTKSKKIASPAPEEDDEVEEEEEESGDEEYASFTT